MFHGLVSGEVAVPGLSFAPVMADIEALNRRALSSGEASADVEALAFTKLSVHVLGLLTERYSVLDSGAALGRGCGPLVVGRGGAERVRSLEELATRRVAIPGRLTTAHLLLRMFSPARDTVVPMRFDQIMPAVAAGECDAGVIIHESRFTYAGFGLELVADLGSLWEESTGLPLPLGIIAADRGLAPALVDAVESGLRRSIEHAWRHPDAPAEFIRAHAQEMDPEVCRQHIGLYVNQHSATLGDEGRAAIEVMLRRGRATGLLPSGAPSPWR